MKHCKVFLIAIMFPITVHAQDHSQPSNASFDSAADSIQKRLEASVAELNALREQVAAETVPLSRKLSDLEKELLDVRLEYQQASRALDTSTLDFNNLRNEIKSREEEVTYIGNLLGEYIRNFESRLHIAEVQRFRVPLEEAKLAPENSNLGHAEVFEAQARLLSEALDRLEDALGGTRFEGTAVDPIGLVKQGTFVLLGPSAIFISESGEHVGTAEQRLGSLEPSIVAFANVEDASAASKLLDEGSGFFPLDPTLGSAHKIEQTQDTLIEHAKKGGPVMYPIIGLAGLALLVAVFKWLSMLFVRAPSQRKIRALLKAVSAGNQAEILRRAKDVGGPAGKMLLAGVEHIDQPRELIEEIMFEKLLATRLRVNSLLPFIALTASTAPLLGLLGTVTGIMNTFTLMTVFGTGDIKTLSSGISEALITTEFGLLVAIPSLLLYAFLSRKARGVVDQMEKAAIALINQLAKTPYTPPPVRPVHTNGTSHPTPETDPDEKELVVTA